jgi:arylsulfatase A-like enzyme
MPRPPRAIHWCAGSALLGLLACQPAQVPAPNVLLLTIDTLRADRTSAYGYERDTTPGLKALARAGVLFERAYSQAPFTAPSHASLFTGLVSQSHGLLHWSSRLDPGAVTMAEHFGAEGYSTGAFFNHASLPVTGLLRGFEHQARRGFDVYERSLADLWAWLDGDGKGQLGQPPFAVWLHFWDVHRPYGFRDWNLYQAVSDRRAEELTLAFAETGFGPSHDPRIGRLEEHYNLNAARRQGPLPVPGAAPRVLGPADWQAISDRYDNGVRFADQGLSALVDGLEQRGLLERTVLCVTSDHGETLTERPGCWFTHDPYLYEEALKVPLVWRFPNQRYKGRRSAALARGIDVLPTLIEAAQLPALETQGRSLLRHLKRSAQADLPLFAQTQTRAAKESGARLERDQGGWLEHRQALFDGRYKLIKHLDQSRLELYDLKQDPAEQRDLLTHQPGDPETQQLRQRLEGELLRLERELKSSGGGSRSQSLEELELLLRLGYITEEDLEAARRGLLPDGSPGQDPGATEPPR